MSEDFEIKYWAGGNDFPDYELKPKRSIKKRLFIVFSFVSILAIIPFLVYFLSEFSPSQGQKVSVVQNQEKKVERKPSPGPTQPKSQTSQVEVLNNDSYWKISKRTCGSGKYYLSILDQNAGKPLHKGETVTVTCAL